MCKEILTCFAPLFQQISAKVAAKFTAGADFVLLKWHHIESSFAATVAQ